MRKSKPPEHWSTTLREAYGIEPETVAYVEDRVQAAEGRLKGKFSELLTPQQMEHLREHQPRVLYNLALAGVRIVLETLTRPDGTPRFVRDPRTG